MAIFAVSRVEPPTLPRYHLRMCNLYSVTKGQAAIRELARAMHDRTGNMPPLPGVFPDYGAPIVRESKNGRELVSCALGHAIAGVRAQG